MRNKCFLILCLFVLSSQAFAQKVVDKSSNTRPEWLNEPPKGKYFNYFSGIGQSGNSLSEAKAQAVSDILNEIIMNKEIVSTGTVTTFQQQSKSEIISKVSREIIQNGSSTTIKALQKEEEYWEITKNGNQHNYRYWILMKIQKPMYQDFDITSLKINPSSGTTPVLKSIVLPGWGQLHKKQKGKGLRILISEVTLASSYVILNYLSRDYNDKAVRESDTENREYYENWSDNFYAAGTISGILAGAVYLYNIFDALTSRGPKVYANKNLPVHFLTMQNSVQVKMTFSF